MKNKIKEYRLEKKLTQTELAKISGVSRTVIAQLESGVRINVTVETMLKISKALGKSVEKIFLL